MKKTSTFLLILYSAAVVVTIISCKKDYLCENCSSSPPVSQNKPPIAAAGFDQVIMLPIDNVSLDGSASSDPDGTISRWSWTKISGPSSFNIAHSNVAQTQVTDLIQGVYQFELTVADDGGSSSKDTVQVAVNTQGTPSLPQLCDDNRPQVNAQLIHVGSLSEARGAIAVASAGNKILFAGGLSGSGQVTSKVDIFDIHSQSWSTAELSKARYLISTASSGDDIFFGGGFSYTGGETDQVDVYNASANSWTTDHLSLAGYNIGAAAVGNKVFFAGGYHQFEADRSSRVDIYDMSTQTWSTSTLSQGRDYITAVAANDKIYFSGGENRDEIPANISNRIDIYDDATNTWSTSSLAEPKYFQAGIGVGDKIYWGGGNSGSCAVEIRDVMTGNSSIQYLSKPGNWLINEGRNAVVKDNKIVFFGHYTWNGANVRFDIYDISTNAWSIGVLPVNIDGASIIAVNNIIYVAGGYVDGVLSTQVWKLEF